MHPPLQLTGAERLGQDCSSDTGPMFDSQENDSLVGTRCKHSPLANARSWQGADKMFDGSPAQCGVLRYLRR